jgi:hypothetical protein
VDGFLMERSGWIVLQRWLRLLAPLRAIGGLFHLPRYVRDWKRYQAVSERSLRIRDSYPRLTDWVESTPFDPHYFYQSAWLARRLATNRPDRHVDVGSDVRMIGVLSAFIPTEFLDYRPLEVNIAGLNSAKGDVMSLHLPDASENSVSCLHVVEHIGLGRYGDDIDPEGSRKALSELSRILAPKGRLFLSMPVGRERVCFNAHRVFDPATVIGMLPELHIVEFSLIDDCGVYCQHVEPSEGMRQEYGCGLFLFEKPCI